VTTCTCANAIQPMGLVLPRPLRKGFTALFHFPRYSLLSKYVSHASSSFRTLGCVLLLLLRRVWNRWGVRPTRARACIEARRMAAMRHSCASASNAVTSDLFIVRPARLFTKMEPLCFEIEAAIYMSASRILCGRGLRKKEGKEMITFD